MKDLLYRLAIEEEGPTAVEYAVMLALILGTVLLSVSLLGNQTAGSFQHSVDEINDAIGP